MRPDLQPKPFPKAAELRRQAEEWLQTNPPATSPRSAEEMQRLVHELEVHQIELEIQNTELRHSRDEVKVLLEKFTDLFEFAPVGYVSLDRDSNILSANLTGADLLGFDRSQLIGRGFDKLVVFEFRATFFAFLAKVFTGQAKRTCELAVLNGRDDLIYLQIEAIASAAGQKCRLAFIDISDRRRLEEQVKLQHAELAARAAELESANIELDAFNYTVSHELKTPLSVFNISSQLLLEICSQQLDKEAKGFIQNIYDGTQQMDRLISTLLSFSRVTRVNMHRESVDLSSMAKLIFAERKLATPERRVELRISDVVSCSGDRDLLLVVMENLLGNAWKFTGGQDAAVIEFSQTEIDGKPCFFVRDNGPGLDMDDAERLFRPFQRFPGTDVEGHGIGLATVDRIIKRHGGRVWAESESGQGATFYFTLK
jgi:PAS domain S-box-containing protein